MAEKLKFTADPVDWRAWLDPIALETATPAQIAVLEESTPTAKTSPYYLLLVRDVDVLRERSRLYNAIMYGPRGLPRADRELAAVAVSRVNGCVYCASVHIQRYIQLTKRPEIMQRLIAEGVEAGLPPRERAIVDFAVKLTRAPSALTSDDLTPLRQLGLTDQEILDLTHATAMFAWANRLMQTLGEPVATTRQS
ncbi:MAG: alkylhydroperoxidase [Caldilinea sp. CFX5]|nr:alkylhydroperoxidase [Caldilinea sp. CFX5]